MALMIAMSGAVAHAQTKQAAKDVVIVHGATSIFYIPPTKFRETYAADVPAPEAQFMADSEQQLAQKAMGAPLSVAVWHNKPSYAILTTQERHKP
jgi:hypothetical protein